jgi:hypothetical protein
MQRKFVYVGIRQQCCWASSYPSSASQSVPKPCQDPPDEVQAAAFAFSEQHAPGLSGLQIDGLV